MSELLGCTIDQIIYPSPMPAVKANFEHILLPYAPIADFTGRSWPRSMSQPAILSAVKLFMGLEERRDMMKRQINDDTEYILQAAFSGNSFGYSWGFDDIWEGCLAVTSFPKQNVSFIIREYFALCHTRKVVCQSQSTTLS